MFLLLIHFASPYWNLDRWEKKEVSFGLFNLELFSCAKEGMWSGYPTELDSLHDNCTRCRGIHPTSCMTLPLAVCSECLANTSVFILMRLTYSWFRRGTGWKDWSKCCNIAEIYERWLTLIGKQWYGSTPKFHRVEMATHGGVFCQKSTPQYRQNEKERPEWRSQPPSLVVGKHQLPDYSFHGQGQGGKRWPPTQLLRNPPATTLPHWYRGTTGLTSPWKFLETGSSELVPLSPIRCWTLACC